ncbi:hypothetical protein Nepgr_024187 [Nepenthes gracilis]|uniref:Uncharacterized protein n=1 Tax=Nepenthes gracilis TaxID=150966 RepID=A0AAD3T448_NEPGR|nr:hypothetical protein Nepgr_024187 [Nepenthes gracilis]
MLRLFEVVVCEAGSSTTASCLLLRPEILYPSNDSIFMPKVVMLVLNAPHCQFSRRGSHLNYEICLLAAETISLKFNKEGGSSKLWVIDSNC